MSLLRDGMSQELPLKTSAGLTGGLGNMQSYFGGHATTQASSGLVDLDANTRKNSLKKVKYSERGQRESPVASKGKKSFNRTLEVASMKSDMNRTFEIAVGGQTGASIYFDTTHAEHEE